MAPQTRNQPQQPQQRQQAARQHGPPQNGNGSQVRDEDANAKLLDDILGKQIEFVPLGEGEKIKLSVEMVKRYLCVPTKNGHMPENSDVIKFMTMCRQRALNPFTGDAYLLGYDTNDGPKFSIVVAIQAFFKRAEINKAFEGIESGVVVRSGDEIIERQGDLTYDGEILLGGWARVHRSDRKFAFYQRLKIQTFARGTKIWRDDPAGMISKCAEMAALRQAFPSEVGGLYLQEELLDLAKASHEDGARSQAAVKQSTAMDQLKERLGQTGGHVPSETVVGKAPAVAVSDVRQEAGDGHEQESDDQGSGSGDGAQEGPGDGDAGQGEAEGAGEHEVKFG